MTRSHNMKDNLFVIISVSLFWYGVYGEDLCPNGWTNDTANDRCIKIMEPLLEQINAMASCKSCGGSLIKLRKPQDQLIVNEMMWIHDKEGKRKDWGYFIDMNDRETTTQWEFEDGESVTWLNWKSGQPNGHTYSGGQHCMALEYPSLKWHDTKCTVTELQYICMRNTGVGGLIKNTFEVVLSGCLTRLSPLGTIMSGVLVDCSAACSTDPCCTAFGSDSSECTLYGMDFSAFSPVCVGPSFKVFTRV